MSLIRVTVNGVIAIVDGDHFVANHLPLEEGENTITVTAVDMEGHSETDSITVYSQLTDTNYVTITADPESGVSPLQATLRVGASFAFGGEPVLTYSGPSAVEVMEGESSYEFIVSISTPGIYYFTVEVIDDQNNVYTDTVGVQVLNVIALDTLLRNKWNSMKASLITGDINKVLTHFHSGARSDYQAIFTLLGPRLPGIASAMREISPIYFEDKAAKYRIKREETVQGRTYDVTYYIYFVKDGNGLWQIESF